MTITHQERVFKRAWTEHQQIRLILAEIQATLGQLSQTQQQQVDDTPHVVPKRLSRRLLDLINQLNNRFTYEGANGEVAITLACDRFLYTEVSALASRWKKLDRALRDLLEVLADCEDSDTQIERLGNAFPQLSSDVASYLSDKMDALRRSLVNVRESVSVSV